ncbi:thermonuclease family protein [Akkermansiaceae bacterium]|nr:thermonuclease family protein [Akkermansiaceae bacterium]
MIGEGAEVGFNLVRGVLGDGGLVVEENLIAVSVSVILARDEITKVGKEGKVFTKNILFKGDFKILTKWEDVVRPGRSYCLVIVEWEGEEVYLHELLVAQGLVRVHTRGCDMPQGRGWKEQRKYLESWEEEVKAKGIGAWGM